MYRVKRRCAFCVNTGIRYHGLVPGFSSPRMSYANGS